VSAHTGYMCITTNVLIKYTISTLSNKNHSYVAVYDELCIILWLKSNKAVAANKAPNINTNDNRTTTIFYGPFRGPPGWASARRELLDFMVQGKINRGRHTDHPAGRHSIGTNQCPPPPSPHFLQAGCPSCSPTNSVKALEGHSMSLAPLVPLGRHVQYSVTRAVCRWSGV